MSRSWAYDSLLMILVYGLANLCGLAASCINPILYGYLNENFRKEYKTFLTKLPWYPADLSKSNDDRSPKNGIEMLPIPCHGQTTHQTPSTIIKSTLNVPKQHRVKYRSCPDINHENDEPCRANNRKILPIPHNDVNVEVINENGIIPITRSHCPIEAPARIPKENQDPEPTFDSINNGEGKDDLVIARKGKIDCCSSVLMSVPNINHGSLLSLQEKSFFRKSLKFTIKDRLTSTTSLSDLSPYATCEKCVRKFSNHIEGSMKYKNSSNVPSKAFDTCGIGVRTFTKHIMSSLKDNISSKDVVIESQLDIVRPVSNNPDEDISSIYTCTDSKCLSYCSVCKCCDILEDQCSVCDSNMVDIQEPTFLSRSMSFPCATNRVSTIASIATLRDQNVISYQRTKREHTINLRKYEMKDV